MVFITGLDVSVWFDTLEAIVMIAIVVVTYV